MKKYILFLITAFSCCYSIQVRSASTRSAFFSPTDTPNISSVKHGLKISTNKHYLTDAVTGEPVFILATTAWNINSLTYAEIDTLINTVAKNGFNSIMFALDFYPQANQANVYGQKAYIGIDKTELNPEYFSYCDHIIDQCTKNGIYPMMYTMWSGKNSGTMNNYTPAQLSLLGEKIGARYKDHKNVILVAGGESSPPYIDTVRVNAMGTGLKKGCEGNELVTVHPCSPHSNSEFYSLSPWLDLYMIQAKSNLSGITFDLTKTVIKDHNKTPVKPTMVAEHRYESGVNEDPIIQRRSLYLSVFAGAFGYAYGHNALWQMTPHTAQPWMMKSWAPGVKDWKEALNTPAAQQLHHIKTLLYSYPYLQRIPDQSLLLTASSDSIPGKVLVMRDGKPGEKDASYIMAYLSSAIDITLNTNVINSRLLNAYWFNPRTGLSEVIKLRFKNEQQYQPKKKTDGQDRVLVVEDASKKYHLPIQGQR